MENIKRYDCHEEYAYAGIVKAGDMAYLNFCVGNVGGSVKEQVEGALDEMVHRLKRIDCDLSSIVQVTVLLRDVWDIPVMEEVFKQYFKGEYPARKTIQTNFAHRGGIDGLKVQIDGIAYCPMLQEGEKHE